MDKKISIGTQNIGGILLPYENALLYYVYGRVTLNTDSFLFLLPSIFYFYHHAIEISLKTALKLKKIKYPNSGLQGHKIYDLLLLAIKNDSFSSKINDLQKNKEMMDILIAMDASYMNNKYDYPGYTIKLPLRAYMDELVSVLFEEINSIVGALTPKHTLANLHVPEPVEQAFLHELKTPLSYTVVGLRKN